MRLFLLVAVLVLVVAGQACAQPSLYFEEHLVLRPTSGDGRMGDPRFVAAGPDERIHIFDQASMQVKVFSPHGAYERSYGGRGRAEGQLLGISAAHVDTEGRTLVIDQMGGRATWFNADGSVASVHALESERILWPRAILPSGERLLLHYRMPGDDALLHEWNRDLSRRGRQWGSWQDMPFHDDPFAASLSLLQPGSVVRWGDELVFTPLLYSDTLIAYRMSEPTRRRIIRGARLSTPSFEQAETPDGRAPELMVVSADERRAARVHATTLGLVPLPSGHLVRLFMRQEGADKQAYAELFSSQGILVATERVGALAAPGHRDARPPLFVAGVDALGGVYVVDWREARPAVRLFKLSAAERRP